MGEACSDSDERGTVEGIPFIGIRQAMRAVVSNQPIQRVYIAKDADRKIVGKLERLCRERGIELCYTDSRLALGRSPRIDVGASTLTIVRK